MNQILASALSKSRLKIIFCLSVFTLCINTNSACRSASALLDKETAVATTKAENKAIELSPFNEDAAQTAFNESVASLKTNTKLRGELAGEGTLAQSTSARELAQAIDEILSEQNKTQHGGRWGVCVRSGRDGRVLYQREGRQLFRPASNLKIYTTAAALELLGADYRWRTSIFTNGSIDPNGTLNGNLILYGRGAPDLSSAGRIDAKTATDNSLNSLADALYQKGLRAVNGRIIADESYFHGEERPEGWLWDDMQWYYGAEPSALTINDNSLLLQVTTANSAAGDKPTVQALPANQFVRVSNDAIVTTGGRTSIGVAHASDDGGASLRVYGEVPKGAQAFGVRVAMPEPALNAGYLLREALNRHGITIANNNNAAQVIARDARSPQTNGNNQNQENQNASATTNSTVNDSTPTNSAVNNSTANLNELAFALSRPLVDVVRTTNKESVNLNAELLLRTLGRERGYGSGQNASQYADDTKAGIAVVRRWLSQSGVDADNFSLHDGSGLSMLNLVTPHATVQLLALMQQTPNAKNFFDSLPVAGTDGTLGGRFGDARGRIHAKTGAVAQTYALSGYAASADDETLIFSIFCNEAPGRTTATIDRIVNLLVKYREIE